MIEFIFYKPSFLVSDYYKATYCLDNFTDQEWTEITKLSLEKVEPTQEEIENEIKLRGFVEKALKESEKQEKEFFGNFIFENRKERNSVLLISVGMFILILILAFAWKQIEEYFV